MEDDLYPPLPSNYVTIVDLQKRWMQQKQQQQEKEEQLKRDKHEQKNHCVLSNNSALNDVVKPRSQFQKFNRSFSDQKPNFGARFSFPVKLYGNKVAEECGVVKKSSNSSGITADTADTASHVISNGDGDCEEKTSRFQKSNCSNYGKSPNFVNRKPFHRNFNGKKPFEEVPVVKNVSNTVAEKSMANVPVEKAEFDDQKAKIEMKNHAGVDEETRVKEGGKLMKKASNSSGMKADTANHVMSNGNGDCEQRFQKSNYSNSVKSPNFGYRKPFHRNFNGKKPFEEVLVVKNVSNTVAEKSIANVAVETAEFDDQKPKIEMKNHAVVDEETRVKEGRKLVKKANNSSGMNADAANHVISNGDGDCEQKSSGFQKSNCSNSVKNPNFGNRKPFHKNFNDKKRFKEFRVVKNVSSTVAEKSVANVAVAATEFDDQKVEKEMMKDINSSDRSNPGKNPNFSNGKQFRRNINGKKRFKEFPVVKTVRDTIAEKSMQNIAEFDDQKAKKDMKIDAVVDEETRVEDEKLVNDQVKVENQTVDEKDSLIMVKDQTVGEKDDQVTVKDQTVEIEQKFKDVSVSRLNGRSTAVMEGKRREYGGYRGGYRRGYGRSWVGERGRIVVVDQFSGSGRSTAEIKGWTGVHRGYSGFENRGKNFWRRGELMWVKKEDC